MGPLPSRRWLEQRRFRETTYESESEHTICGVHGVPWRRAKKTRALQAGLGVRPCLNHGLSLLPSQQPLGFPCKGHASPISQGTGPWLFGLCMASLLRVRWQVPSRDFVGSIGCLKCKPGPQSESMSDGRRRRQNMHSDTSKRGKRKTMEWVD